MKTKHFIQSKQQGKKWVLLTAYDTPTAELLEETGIDMILIGDSLGMVALGYPSTTFVTMDEMIHHAKAVRRGAKKTMLIGDIPLKGRNRGPKHALESAKRFMKEGGCEAVKLEWGRNILETVALLRKHRIPVMGHVGLTPQTISKKNGFVVQGRQAKKAYDVLDHAKAFEAHGAFAVVLECIPRRVAGLVTKALKVPTFGIGAGLECDGQILVFQDLVGSFTRFRPRFVKRYANTHQLMKKAVANYKSDILSLKFPSNRNSFRMDAKEFNQLKSLIKQRQVQ